MRHNPKNKLVMDYNKLIIYDALMNEVQALRTEQRNIALMNGKSVLSVDEAALYMGLSVSYLYKLTRTKAVPYYKCKGGKMIYFKKNEIDDWLLYQRIETDEFLQSKAELQTIQTKTTTGRTAK